VGADGYYNGSGAFYEAKARGGIAAVSLETALFTRQPGKKVSDPLDDPMSGTSLATTGKVISGTDASLRWKSTMADVYPRHGKGGKALRPLAMKKDDSYHGDLEHVVEMPRTYLRAHRCVRKGPAGVLRDRDSAWSPFTVVTAGLHQFMSKR
jgi:hypothetical protein